MLKHSKKIKSYVTQFSFAVSPRTEKDSSPNPLFKKPRRRFLRTLFCCFSRNSNSKSTKSSLSNQDGSSSPVSPGTPCYLLDAIRQQDIHKKCMVIDLDETLVHSSFKVRISLNLLNVKIK